MALDRRGERCNEVGQGEVGAGVGDGGRGELEVTGKIGAWLMAARTCDS